MSEDFVKVAKAKSPNKYHGVVPALGAKKFFEKNAGMYVVFKGEVPKAPEPEVAEVDATETVEPSFIRRKPKAGASE